ncbi:TniB family NTP-binding protein [Caulobacter endophyticus]|uniref:TniB family NTP-binding protein n=1 Tax=Caulobacter endophyticus TaxID=2172652 RepID=UPI00240EC05F|nr:TniB family NTP-binding protein [Caulobacter endophyticus]MDG2527596.1 TniB family NTP-binding protein [Caulobacter endophyticus]
MNSLEIARKVALFQQIYIAYPPHISLHEWCAYLVELGRATRGRPQKGMRALGPSGSGKTAAMLAFIHKFLAKTPRTADRVPIVFVTLERAATSKRLMISILEYFGDCHSSRGTEQSLKMRVKACFERFGTELLIIDEIQHLNYRNSERSDVTDSLKRLLDDGVVPIVFLGTEEANGLFTRNVQLGGRLISPCDFKPLDLQLSADRALLAGYATLLNQSMVKKGVFQELSCLEDPFVLACLHAVSDGVIGRVSRLVEIALEIALRRAATRIEKYDLALAVDRWAIPNGITATNPFLRDPVDVLSQEDVA